MIELKNKIKTLFSKIKKASRDIFLKIKKSIKNILPKIRKKIKLFFSNKTNVIITIIVIAVAIIVIVFSIINRNRNKLFVLNHIYDIYPQEVRDLYSNVVSISWGGDLYFDVELDLLNEIKEYQYGDFVYTIKRNRITRKKKECINNNNYISYLYGYSWNNDELSIDINIGYLKDNTLYDLEDNNLGEYRNDALRLFEIFNTSSYYRLNYVKKKGIFKLKSVELISRG